MECFGLVGLPNAGKSSLYNALTGGGALAAPYPFATKDPNIGVAKVPDDRLLQLSEMSKQTAAATSTTGMSHNAIVGALVSESYGAGSWKPVLKALAEARYSQQSLGEAKKGEQPCS